MKKPLLSLLLLLSTLIAAKAAEAGKLNIAVFPAKEANVNAYVFWDGKGALIVDATRNSKDAAELAKFVRSKGADPGVILITHGHPDHYFGLAVLRKEFPRAKILVASKEVKEDIIQFTRFMESKKWLEAEPALKEKTQSNPGGFDYEKEIGVLAGNEITLPGGSVLEVSTGFPPTEAAHETVLYSKDLNALFASDLVYNHVHLWMGNGVDHQAAENWKAELDRLNATYGPLKPTVYPGHGPATDTSIFATDKKYIDDLLAAVASAKSPDEAKARMIAEYPGWQNTDFLLAQSVKFQTAQLPKK
jgi:glyoxylase-like metal-dependent hydrolase (beta-lactamase superfamily II)